MSYNPNTQTINAPVSVYDVQQVLATSDNDVGRLCVHSAINMWARYKPVPYPSVTESNDGKGNVEHTSTRKLVCGLDIPLTTSPLADYRNNRRWMYVRPQGGMGTPYRLADFNGYNHVAQMPIRTGFAAGVWQDVNIFASSFVINLLEGEINLDTLSSSSVPNNIMPSVVAYACPSATKDDMSTWQSERNLGTAYSDTPTRINLVVADLTRDGFSIEDGRYYAFVISMTDNSQMVRFLLPWNNSNYFAALFHVTALPFFKIDVSQVILQPDPSDVHVWYNFRSTEYAANQYTVSSIPSVFTLRFYIATYTGYNGLSRAELNWGTTDLIRIRINGRSEYVYEAASYDPESTTVQSTETSSYLTCTFNTGSDNPWMLGSGTYQRNSIEVYASHDGGVKWMLDSNSICYVVAEFK